MKKNRRSILTFLGKEAFVLEFDVSRPRVVIILALDQRAVEHIKLLSTVPGDGPAEGPNHGEQEQTLQPHGDLLVRHRFAFASGCSDFI